MRTIALFLFSIILPLGAQDQEPPKVLRVLPLGDKPPFRQELRGGVRQELPPRPGEVPPPEMSIPVAQGELQNVKLRLRQMSRPMLIPAAVDELRIGQAGAEGVVTPWFARSMPSGAHSLLLLWRDPASKTWDKPKGFFLKDDPQTFPAGSIRLTNVYNKVVDIAMGTKKFALKPGKVQILRLGAGKHPLAIFLMDEKGNKVRLFENSVTVGSSERSNVFIYGADGVGKRRPAKVTIKRELANIRVPEN